MDQQKQKQPIEKTKQKNELQEVILQKKVGGIIKKQENPIM